MSSGPTYSVGTIAKLLMLTETRVQQLVNEGVIPRTGRGRYELAPVVQGYIRYLKDRSVGKDIPGDQMATIKQRLYLARAEQAELDIARARQELVPAEALGRFLASVVTQARMSLIRIPRTLKQRNPLMDQRAVDDADELIRAALEQLAASNIPDELFADLESGGGGLEAKAEEDG